MEMKRIKGKNPRGVRLHHPSLKNCVLTVAEGRKYPGGGFKCPLCGLTHIWKTHHLVLDQHGNVVVHEGIYDLLKREGIIHDLKAMREVTPRSQIVAPGTNLMPEIVVATESGPVKLPGMNGHGRV
jgi:hypothetical protein